MRVSPVGWYCNSIDAVLAEAKKSAEVTHNHPEGIKGAQAAAAAVYLARSGKTKNTIKKFIVDRFGYNLDRSIDTIRPNYNFDVSCQGSVPEAIIAFLESSDFENAIRLAVSLGGDSDTIACITGGIAEAFYKTIPEYIAEMVSIILGPDLMIDVVIPFSEKYGNAL
jgi:ADP-ribosylglycohydrolase